MPRTTSAVVLVECPECYHFHPQAFWGSCEDRQNSYTSQEEYVARHPESTQRVEVLEFA
jgi:hypothetical protein